MLTRLPPTPEEVTAFVADPAADAYERLIDRLLASCHYGVHWGKHWLDATGYADTNGYFGKESDRAHAWRYRDYVVASINADKPFDRFIREQLARGRTGRRDAALEAVEQVVYSSLLGLSIKCARCHDHKFEPLTQREHYQAQVILYPAFNPEKWVKPRERMIRLATGDERAAWEANQAVVETRLAAARAEHRGWMARHRPRGECLFGDDGTPPASHGTIWTPAPKNAPPARFDAAGLVVDAAVESWLATSPIEWVDPEVGAAVQVTFDLVADRAAAGLPGRAALRRRRHATGAGAVERGRTRRPAARSGRAAGRRRGAVDPGFVPPRRHRGRPAWRRRQERPGHTRRLCPGGPQLRQAAGRSARQPARGRGP